MKNYHDTTPQTKDPFPTTPGNDIRSLLPYGASVELTDIDNLLKWDEAFYRTESKILAAFAARMRVPPSEIEDAVEEAWFSVVEHRNQLEGVGLKKRLHRWLQRVIFRKAVDRHRQLHRSHCESLQQTSNDPIDDAQAKRVKMAELREWLEALMEEASLGNLVNLSLMRARFFQGLPVHELAQRFHLTPDAIKARIQRLEARMREHIGKNPPQ